MPKYNEEKTNLIEKLKQSLPQVFGRTAIEELMPGLINPKTLANLSSIGQGPQTFKQGRKVFYERDSFLEWLEKRIRVLAA